MTDLDRYLDDFGTRLQAAEPPPRRRGLAFGALAVMTAAIVVAVVLIAPGGGARPVDAVAAARAALAPPNEIVYMRVRNGSGKFQSVTDQWSAQDPLRWRFVYRYPSGTRVRDMDGPIRGRVETGYAAGRQSTYFVARNTMRVLKDLPDDGAHARMPGLIGQGGADPQTDLRAMLAAGKLKDTGEVQAGGRTVRRLVSDSEHRDIRRVVTFDVDPVTFAPVQGSYQIIGPHELKPPKYGFTVVRYERLPITAETEKLLAIQTNAKTKVTVLTVPQFRAQIKRDGRP